MTNVTRYKRWLASAESQRRVVETIDVNHPSWGNIRIVNADRNLSATLENGSIRTFIAGRFYLDPAEITDTTSQYTTMTISSLDGLIYDKVKSMSFDDRETPITLKHRLYFLDDPTYPLISPPPSWIIHGIEATREFVKAELRAEALRIRKIGMYYTTHEFPALVYI